MASFITDFFIKMEMLVYASPKVTANPYHNMPSSSCLTEHHYKKGTPVWAVSEME